MDATYSYQILKDNKHLTPQMNIKHTYKRSFKLYLTSPYKLEGEWLGDDDMLFNGFWTVDSFYFYKE